MLLFGNPKPNIVKSRLKCVFMKAAAGIEPPILQMSGEQHATYMGGHEQPWCKSITFWGDFHNLTMPMASHSPPQRSKIYLI